MPPTKSPNHWALSELLGQRKLLVFGALLAWLVLFHLLVNVWLLCVFTSFLVVLGGWLGSRALLDANSVLHLEHFLPLGKLQPSPQSPESEWRLDHEIHNAVNKAMRDFVSSWYRTLVSEEGGEFEHVVRDSMLESMMDLKERARHVDRKALVRRALELFGCHLQSYMTAKEMQAESGLLQKDGTSLWQLYSKVITPHPALSSAATELSYSRALVSVMLHVLVPYPHMETRTGGYMVAELITCNVLSPLVNRVSDPDWLNQTIVDVFTKSREPPQDKVDELSGAALYSSQIQHESWTTCHSMSSHQTALSAESHSCLGELSDQCQTLPKDCSQDSVASLESSSSKGESCHQSLMTPCRVNCFYQRQASDQDSFSSESKKLSAESLIPIDSEDDPSGGFCDCVPPSLCSGVTSREEDFGCFGPLRVLAPKVVVSAETHWPAGMAQEPPRPSSVRGPCLTPCHFESPNNLSLPVRIQNVRIAGTVPTKEQRGTSTQLYTLYTVKFETVVDPKSESVSHHTVNRRYSEFLSLQTRLEENPQLKKMIKNVKGPKKLFPDLSFGNVDVEKADVRKGQLDTFLKQLSNIPETASSEEMQEFLSLNTEGGTAFEKPKSRLDKMVVNALDTLKTAFPRSEPQSPTEDLEGDSDGLGAEYRKLRSKLRFSSKIAPSLNIADLQPKVTYCFSEGSSVLNGMSLAGLETFTRAQEKALQGQPSRESGETKQSCDQLGKDRRVPGKHRGTDTEVADVALNILCLLMRGQWSWLCTENIQKTIRLLFGTFIERWLDVGVSHLTSVSCWVIYLQVMQEAVWPGGLLPAHSRPERSAVQREDTRKQCLDCLMQLLPEFITDMLGAEKYRVSLETVLESLQDSHINRHLVFSICDLLLEFLIPEAFDEAFQRNLLSSLSKDIERETLYT